jgi:hypothetical protein
LGGVGWPLEISFLYTLPWDTLAIWYAKQGERRRTLPNAPLVSQLSPLPVSAHLVLMKTLNLREGGLGVGRLMKISLLDTLPLIM